MGDNPYLLPAIRIIGSLTRENLELGARAFKIWKENRFNPENPGKGFDPSECVDLAIKELYGEKLKGGMTMTEKQNTYGEFVDLMEKLAVETGNVDAQIAIEDWKALATEKQWKEFRPLLLAPDLVINFAENMVSSFREHISGTCTDELYMQRKKDGHEFLRKIHETVVGLGIDIDVRKIDVPLTPTDLLVGAGLAETKEGKIRLTPKGERLVMEAEEELTRAKH